MSVLGQSNKPCVWQGAVLAFSLRHSTGTHADEGTQTYIRPLSTKHPVAPALARPLSAKHRMPPWHAPDVRVGGEEQVPQGHAQQGAWASEWGQKGSPAQEAGCVAARARGPGAAVREVDPS